MERKLQEKNVLFLSSLDFKDKSIQVIRKTPEAYVKRGWNVQYIVIRDNSKGGNYFYEEEINPLGVNVYRFSMPLTRLYDKIANPVIKALISRTRNYLTVLKLAHKGNKILKKQKVDIIYGYEVNGVLAMNLLKKLGRLKGIKTVSRFQGVFYIKEFLLSRNYLRYCLNYEHVLALKKAADLCIMTNDGTQGISVLKKLKSKGLKNIRFWPNGVDRIEVKEVEAKALKDKFGPNNEIILTVCRLEQIKRVDRGLLAVAGLIKNFNFQNVKYLILGDGREKASLMQLAEKLGIEEHVHFIGAVKNSEVKNYLQIADYFISTFESSNVGNPLLEAIRANKIIFTLNNGDTGQWISHYKNGFIYDINKMLAKRMADDLHHVITSKELRQKILQEIKHTEQEKLWTWEERMNAEITEVTNLLKGNYQSAGSHNYSYADSNSLRKG